MSVEIFLVFLVIFGALFLFITERFPVDITAFLLLITLTTLGIFFPDSFPSVSEGLSGLSNNATVTVLAMFVLSAGIQKTGIVYHLGKRIFSFVGNSEVRQLFAIGIFVGPISAFINNTAAVAILLPMILDLARRSGTSATKLLIPLSFFGMLGGTMTLIGTSTNILASDILGSTTGKEIGLFEFSGLGMVVFAIGLVYFLLVGRFLLPDREGEKTKKDEEFLTEVVIEKESEFLGKTIKESHFEHKTESHVIKIIRDKTSFIKNAGEKVLEEGDILVLRTTEQRIIDLAKKTGIKLLPNFDEDMRRRTIGGKVVKILIRGGYFLTKKNIDEIDFWGAAIVGIRRRDFSAQRLGSMKAESGEIMLVSASLASLKKIKNSKDVLLLEEIEEEFQPEKMWTALGIVAGVVGVSAIFNFPIVISALAGVIAMFLTKCIAKDELYNAINWEVIFLLAGVIPLGIAMQKSGAAGLIAERIADVSGGASPIFVLAIFYLVTTLLTETISNNAAVVLLVPIAVSVGAELYLDPFPIVLAVMFAASTSFLTPVGYQTNTMVYGSGNYKFSDFVKVGAPLNIILLFSTVFLIDFWWPLA